MTKIVFDNDIEELMNKNTNNNIFNKSFSKDYNYLDLCKSRKNSKIHNIEIKKDILDILEKVIPLSHNYKFKSYEDLTSFFTKMRKKYGKKYGKLFSTKKPILIAHYRKLYKEKQIERNYELEKFLKLCGSRSRSGVISVTIFTKGELLNDKNKIKTGGCPMDCHYCPFEKDEKGVATQPRSYLSTEPGNLRATQNKHHPVGQVYDRIRQLENTGHISNDKKDISKIEGIISGATFSFYPKDYITWFVTCMYYAYNTYYDWKKMRKMGSLEEEKKINETCSLRVIGLTIETRPDYITPKKKGVDDINFEELKFFRKIGVTRVQIGIQTTDDYILKKINRKCTNEMNKIGIRRLKQNGFKTDIHIMLDLPYSSPEKDKQVIDEIIYNPDYQADQWKIYPTETTPYTKIREWYLEGKYKPYSEDNEYGTAYKLIDVIIYAMKKVPKYVRVNRVVRDFPNKSIDGGLKYSNARQLVKEKMDKMKIKCNDIREREIKNEDIDIYNIKLSVEKYKSSGGEEYFISYTNKDKNLLYGFIRLRLNKEYNDVMDSIKECALIRELHIYGNHTPVGVKIDNRAQHLGLGKSLIKKAEDISIKNKYKKIAVISGVGVRNYYIKKGYKLGEDEYMFKKLDNYYINIIKTYFLSIFLFFLLITVIIIKIML
tara:strand:- start:1647 stop:3623 length:1977 start_codon:yes stop_codon:yes gene_type:complete